MFSDNGAMLNMITYTKNQSTALACYILRRGRIRRCASISVRVAISTMSKEIILATSDKTASLKKYLLLMLVLNAWRNNANECIGIS